MCNLDVSRIVIAHRISEKGAAAIIALFNRKADRINFYRQKNKMLKFWANHTAKPNVNNKDHSDSEVSLPGLEQENSYICMNESLTSMNRMLLREARKWSKSLKYEFPGYTGNGQVRVKSLKVVSIYLLTESEI